MYPRFQVLNLLLLRMQGSGRYAPANEWTPRHQKERVESDDSSNAFPQKHSSKMKSSEIMPQRHLLNKIEVFFSLYGRLKYKMEL